MKKVFLFAVCVLVTQVCASQPVQERSPQKLKLLSWNIYMLPGVISNLNGRRAEAIGKWLAASDYDIVVFQEAFCPDSWKPDSPIRLAPPIRSYFLSKQIADFGFSAPTRSFLRNPSFLKTGMAGMPYPGKAP